MGRLLRERKNATAPAGAKLTLTQLTSSGTKTRILRHALSDKTNSSESDFPMKSTMSVIKTKIWRPALASRTNVSGSDSPAECAASKIKSNTRSQRHASENEACSSENSSLVENTTGMSLRHRKNKKPSNDSPCEKLLQYKTKPFHQGVICSPRIPSEPKKQTYSFRDLNADKKINMSFIQLEDISELVEKHCHNKKSAKAPIYKTSECDNDCNSGLELLPEEKMKLYDYEVNANSPKQVLAKRKRKPRKKVKKADSEFSDEENSPVRSVVKRLRTSSCSLPSSRKRNVNTKPPTSSVKPNRSKGQAASVLHVPASPIKSFDIPMASTPKIVKFAADLPSVNYMTNVSTHLKDPSPSRSLRFLQQEIGTPIAKIPSRQIKKSIYINPAEILDRNFSPDGSIPFEINTTGDNTVNSISSPSQSLKQTRINSFFPLSAKSGNDTTSNVPNHTASGLFEEGPTRFNSESLSIKAASAAGQFVTMRRRAMCHAKPRVSGLERTPQPEKAVKPMTIENCFGFDNDDDAEDSFVPPSAPYRSLPLLVSSRAICSTPITVPQPTQVCVRDLAVSAVKATEQAKLPIPLACPSKRPAQSSLSDAPIAFISEYQHSSPPLILSGPETLMPVIFGDEPSFFYKPARRSYQRTPRPKRDYTEASEDEDEPVRVTKKPKKKAKQYLKKQKKDVDDWASNINRQFEEIEDMDLVVE